MHHGPFSWSRRPPNATPPRGAPASGVAPCRPLQVLKPNQSARTGFSQKLAGTMLFGPNLLYPQGAAKRPCFLPTSPSTSRRYRGGGHVRTAAPHKSPCSESETQTDVLSPRSGSGTGHCPGQGQNVGVLGGSVYFGNQLSIWPEHNVWYLYPKSLAWDLGT